MKSFLIVLEQLDLNWNFSFCPWTCFKQKFLKFPGARFWIKFFIVQLSLEKQTEFSIFEDKSTCVINWNNFNHLEQIENASGETIVDFVAKKVHYAFLTKKLTGKLDLHLHVYFLSFWLVQLLLISVDMLLLINQPRCYFEIEFVLSSWVWFCSQHCKPPNSYNH